MYINEPIKKYIEDLSARIPAPGGGSATGACGAIGIALLEMVCNFTIGKEKFKDIENNIKKNLSSLERIKKDFTSIIDEDVKIYSKINNAFKSKDKKLIDRALKEGYDISLKMCQLSRDGLQIALELSGKSNPNLITDVGCAAEFLNASFASGVFNADINLKGIEDKVFKKKGGLILDSLKKETEVLYRNTIIKTKERMK